MKKRHFAPLAALVGIVVGAGTAAAAPLGLTVKFPDIVTTHASVVFTAGYFANGDGLLQVTRSGASMTLDLDDGVLDSNSYNINNGASYSLAARITPGGGLVVGSNSNLSISGQFSKNIFPVTVLADGIALAGNLSEMGFGVNSNGQSIIEFKFLVTDGYLRDLKIFGNSGESIITSSSGTLGAVPFTSDFSWTSARVDTFVPTPAAAASGSVLLSGLLFRRRTRVQVLCTER